MQKDIAGNIGERLTKLTLNINKQCRLKVSTYTPPTAALTHERVDTLYHTVYYLMTQIFSVLFADDTDNVCSNENVLVLQDTLNRELAKLCVWFSIKKLSLTFGKATYMLFQSRPPDLELHLKINNADMPKVTATKFLGITIGDRLLEASHPICEI